MPLEPLTVDQPNIQDPEEWQVDDKSEQITIPESKFFVLSGYEARINLLESLWNELFAKASPIEANHSAIFLTLEEMLDRLNAILFNQPVDTWASESWREWRVIEDDNA